MSDPIKFSEIPFIEATELSSEDKLIVRDVSDTTGPQSDENGAIKQVGYGDFIGNLPSSSENSIIGNIPVTQIETPNIDWDATGQEYSLIWDAVNTSTTVTTIPHGNTVLYRTKRIEFANFNDYSNYTVTIHTWLEKKKYIPTGTPTPEATVGTGGNITLNATTSSLTRIEEETYIIQDGTITNGFTEDLGTVSSGIAAAVNALTTSLYPQDIQYLFKDDDGNEWVYNGSKSTIGTGVTTTDSEYRLLTEQNADRAPEVEEDFLTIIDVDGSVYQSKHLLQIGPGIDATKQDNGALKLSVAPAQYITDFKINGITATNPTSRIEVPTPDGSGQVTHPKEIYIPEGFRGYKYWMAGTPFPNGQDVYENPNIWVSKDGQNWVILPGFTNPIQPTPPTDYYADTHLMYTNGVMYCYYRYFTRTGGSGTPLQEAFIEVQSLTAVASNWSTKRRVITFTQGGGSPVFYQMNDKYYCLHIDFLPQTGQPRKLYRLESDFPDKEFTNQVECVVNGIYSGKDLWHLDAINVNGQIIALFNNCQVGTNGENGVLQLATSNDDGITFNLASNLLIPENNTGLFNTHYRSSLTFRYPFDLVFKIAGVSDDTPTPAFNIGYSETTFIGGTVVTPPSVITALTYDNVPFTTNSILTAPIDHFFNTTGTKLFLLGPGLDSIVEHDLTIAGNISAVGNGTQYDISTIESGLLGAAISDDGTYILIAGTNNSNHRIKRLNLTTADTFSGGFSLDANELDTASIVDSPRTVCILKGGDRALIATGVNGNYNIYQLNMTTGNLSTVTHVKTLDLQSHFAGSTSGIADISKSVNEEYLYISDVGSQKIVSFQFGTLGEIDTLVKNAEVVITDDATPLSARFNTVGDKFIVNGYADKALLQYTPPGNNKIAQDADISTKEVVLVIDGDSLTQGINNAGPSNDQYIGNQVLNHFDSFTESFTLNSQGVSGESLQEKLPDVATRIYPLAETGKDNILIAWADANSIIQILSYSDGTTPDNSSKVNETTQYNDYVTYFTGATDFQNKILITGFMPRVDGNGDYKITLPSGVTLTIDPASVDTLETFYDNVKNADISTVPWTHHIDLRDLPNIGGVKGQTIDSIYFADYLHLQTAGYNEIVTKLNSYIHAILT